MITEPHPNDVLSGRGRGINKHEGNQRWRDLISSNRPTYIETPRNQRPYITESIVKAVRALTPPGRFLAKDPNSGVWYEIGEEKANEKTAQAMRDSKKTSNSKEREPQQQQEEIVVPVVVSKSTPNSPKRVNTDDTFGQRLMQDCTFTAPLRRSSSLSCISMLEEDFDDYDQLVQSCPRLSTGTCHTTTTSLKRTSTWGSQFSISMPSRLSGLSVASSVDMMNQMELLAEPPQQQQQQQQAMMEVVDEFMTMEEV